MFALCQKRTCYLVDHFVGTHTAAARQFETERLCGLAICDELESRYPLDRKIGGIWCLSDLVHEEPATKDCNNIRSVAQNTASPWDFRRTNREKPSSRRQRHNCSDVAKGQGVVAGLDRLGVRLFHFLKGIHRLAQLPQSEWLQFDIERLRGRLHCLRFWPD